MNVYKNYVDALVRTKIRSERGASAVEYGLLVAAIAAVIVAVVFVLGGLVKGGFDTTCSTMDRTNSAGC